MQTGQIGLRIKGIDVRGPAGHEEEDDPLSLGGEVRRKPLWVNGRNANLTLVSIKSHFGAIS